MSNSVSPCTLAGFSAQLGSSFAVGEPAGVALELFEVQPLASAAPGEQRFSLMFRGPTQPVLEQATHALAHPVMGALAIFLVPVGRDAGGVHYQAIFN